jgi:hypothetical protein
MVFTLTQVDFSLVSGHWINPFSLPNVLFDIWLCHYVLGLLAHAHPCFAPNPLTWLAYAS